MSERPLWRWWLFCAAVALDVRFHWQWASDLMAWCVLPRWLGAPGSRDGGEPT